MEIIAVPGFHNDTRPSQLRFKVYPRNKCVFSQITPGGQTTSSINLARHIIETICSRKGWNPRNFRFFDFQSAAAYPHGEKKAGMYEFDELIFDRTGRISWVPVKCPDYVEKDFALQDVTPSQLLSGKTARSF